MFKEKLFNFVAVSILAGGMLVSGAAYAEASFNWDTISFSSFFTHSFNQEDEGSLPRHCPMPLCVAPPDGCQYVADNTVGENGCPAFPCGKLECEPEPTPTPFLSPGFIDIDSLFDRKRWFDDSGLWLNW